MASKAARHYGEDERIVMRLLWEQYPDAGHLERRTDIFNRVFRHRHSDLGLPHGRDSKSLTSQWADRLRLGREAVWHAVVNGPLEGASPKWEDLRRRIRAATSAGGPVDDDDDADAAAEERPRVPQHPTRDGYMQTSGARCHPPKHVAGLRAAESRPPDATRARGGDDEVHDAPETGETGVEVDADPTPTRPPPNADEAQPAPTDSTQAITPAGTVGSYKETPLPMLHKSQLIWASDTAYWKPGENGSGFVALDSPVYKAGGKVHRITTSDSSSRSDHFTEDDYMVCSHCPDCGIDNVPLEDDDQGTPFVHTADTMRHRLGLLFDPIARPTFDRQNSGSTDASLKNVIYRDGKPRITACCIVRNCFCYHDALLRGDGEAQPRVHQSQ